jgi:hypothetical protein
VPEGEDVFEEFAFPPGQFSDELIESTKAWLTRILAGGDEVTIDEILDKAQSDGFDEVGCRCITYWLFRSFHPATDVFGVDVGVEGRFTANFAEGSGLRFTDRTAKPDKENS